MSVQAFYNYRVLLPFLGTAVFLMSKRNVCFFSSFRCCAVGEMTQVEDRHLEAPSFREWISIMRKCEMKVCERKMAHALLKERTWECGDRRGGGKGVYNVSLLIE